MDRTEFARQWLGHIVPWDSEEQGHPRVEWGASRVPQLIRNRYDGRTA
jgi:hypothetical protein